MRVHPIAHTVADAASYRFKVSDVHYVYKGDGGGQLKAKIRGGRVTFRGTRRFLQSSEIKVPGTVLTDSSPYSVEMVGIPDENCEVPPPPQFTNGDGCHPLIRHSETIFGRGKGTARWSVKLTRLR